MECIYCEEELSVHDYYGYGNPFSSNFKKEGDIYKCENEECEAYEGHFYTDRQDNLHEGYPC